MMEPEDSDSSDEQVCPPGQITVPSLRHIAVQVFGVFVRSVKQTEPEAHCAVFSHSSP
jgi:hypothetical protein